MSEVVEFNMDEFIVLEKEKFGEGVANNEREMIKNMLKEEDMLHNNVKSIIGC